MYITPLALVDQIHRTPTQAVIITSGGGSGVFEALTHRGGGSATLIAGYIPYNEDETIALLGTRPDKLVSEKTTRAMAMKAFELAVRRRGDFPVIGVACSSILQRVPTEREGRIHYIYCALQTADKTVSITLTINKKLIRSSTPETIRVTEERWNVEMLLNLIAEGCGMEHTISHDHLHSSALFVRYESFLDHPYLKSLMYGQRRGIGFTLHENGEFVPCYDEPSRLIFPGSFNPFHEAHLEMMKISAGQMKMPCDLELSIHNVDKPGIDLLQLKSRMGSIVCKADLPVNLWVTNTSTFVEKAKFFAPETTFVIGMDTACRIVDPKYAGPIEYVNEVFKACNSKFIVFPRGSQASSLVVGGQSDPDDRAQLKSLLPRITFLDYPAYLLDVSSSAIRNV